MCALRELRGLDVSYNPFAHPPARLPPRLTRLALRGCRLEALPGALSTLRPTLADLDASGNLFHLAAGSLPPLAGLALTALRLSSCSLTEAPRELAGMGPTLRLLDLSENHDLGQRMPLWARQGSACRPLAPLWALHQLRSLDLSSCDLKSIPPQLAASASVLEELGLSGNTFLTPGPCWGDALGPGGLGVLTALRRLRLHDCRLHEWPAGLLALPSLEVGGRRAGGWAAR